MGKNKHMNRRKLFYWIITVLMSFFMLFAAWFAETHQYDFTTRMGFPAYFRVELSIAKVIGAIVLLIPVVPARVKEWVYVGFSICMISAIIAKCCSGYAVGEIAQPVFSLIIYLVLAVLLQRFSIKDMDRRVGLG